MSDWVTDWDSKNPYTMADMAGDALAVMDALGVERAHFVGLSMGGMTAQEAALQQPARAASLTLMMTSGYIGDPDLPGMTSRYFLGMLAKGIPLLKYRIRGGEKNLIRERIAKQISYTGYEGLDVRGTAEAVVYDLRARRGTNMRAVLQHQAAVTVAGSRYERLAALDIPTLVIHGTADQCISIEHGRKLVEVIPNARGLWLEDMGHGNPVANLDAVMPGILAHLDGA